MKTKEFYTENEAKDILFGNIGTQTRDEYESELKIYLIGEAIKQAREKMNLTQEELGEKIGVKKAQISKIENGRNITFATILRIFKAMGVHANLDMGTLGKVSLW